MDHKCTLIAFVSFFSPSVYSFAISVFVLFLSCLNIEKEKKKNLSGKLNKMEYKALPLSFCG